MAMLHAMNDTDALRRAAVVGVAIALLVSVPASVAFFAAFSWDIEAATFGDPSAVLDGGPAAAALLRWGAVGDMFFSYLLLAPLALYLHRRLRANGPWLADLGAIAGFAYIFVGAAGAAILAIAGSSLVEAYAIAPVADQPAIAASFGMVRDIVFFALWQMLDPITAGTWVLTTGVLLRNERPMLSRLLIVVGAALVTLSAMSMLGTHSVAVLVLIVAVAFVVWAAWSLIARRPGEPAR